MNERGNLLWTVLSRVATVLVLSLAFSSHDVAAEPYTHPSTRLAFPDRLAGMEKTTVSDYEKKWPGFGVGVDYNAPSITLSIYIYTMGLKNIPSDFSSPVLRKELSKAIEEVRKPYDDVRITSRGEVILGTSVASPKALAASFDYTQDGTRRQSELYLLAYHDHFFKVRFTYDKSSQAAAGSARGQLREELGKMLQSDTGRASRR